MLLLLFETYIGHKFDFIRFIAFLYCYLLQTLQEPVQLWTSVIGKGHNALVSCCIVSETLANVLIILPLTFPSCFSSYIIIIILSIHLICHVQHHLVPHTTLCSTYSCLRKKAIFL